MSNSRFIAEDSITISSKTAGSYSNSGVWTEGTNSSRTILGNVQPEKQYVVDREGLKRLQKTGNIIIYTTEALKISDTNQTADFVTIGGKVYELSELEHWKGITQEFYKYLGVLRNAN